MQQNSVNRLPRNHAPLLGASKSQFSQSSIERARPPPVAALPPPLVPNSLASSQGISSSDSIDNLQQDKPRLKSVRNRSKSSKPISKTSLKESSKSVKASGEQTNLQIRESEKSPRKTQDKSSRGQGRGRAVNINAGEKKKLRSKMETVGREVELLRYAVKVLSMELQRTSTSEVETTVRKCLSLLYFLM